MTFDRSMSDPTSFLAAPEGIAALALLVEDRIEVQLHAWKGRLWTRVSTQVYNDGADVARLADAVGSRC